MSLMGQAVNRSTGRSQSLRQGSQNVAKRVTRTLRQTPQRSYYPRAAPPALSVPAAPCRALDHLPWGDAVQHPGGRRHVRDFGGDRQEVVTSVYHNANGGLTRTSMRKSPRTRSATA